MKIRKKLLLISIGVIVVLLIVARLTGIYQLYTIPAGGMEPALSVKQMILASNLKSPERNDIVIFTRLVNEKFETDPNGKKNVFCYRLIAKGGDKLEIKNGYAYVNCQLADDTTKLKFPYTLPGKDLTNLLTVLEIDETDRRYSIDIYSYGNEGHAYLSYDEYAKAKNVISLTKVLMNSGNLPTNIYQGENFNVDKFGPYLVPPDHFFVMGDNRHNAMDSRYTGPIPVKDCKGVLITKL